MSDNNGISRAIYEHLQELAPHHASFSDRERPSIVLLSEAKQEIDRLRLTDEEREALEFAVETGRVATHDTAILRTLLERLK
jgi:hypothetical protein